MCTVVPIAPLAVAQCICSLGVVVITGGGGDHHFAAVMREKGHKLTKLHKSAAVAKQTQIRFTFTVMAVKSFGSIQQQQQLHSTYRVAISVRFRLGISGDILCSVCSAVGSASDDIVPSLERAVRWRAVSVQHY